MKSLNHSGVLFLTLLGGGLMACGLGALRYNPEKEKVNTRLNHYFNQAGQLDQDITRISVRKTSGEARTSTLTGVVSLRQGEAVPFQVRDVFAEGFEEIEAWCPPRGDCRTRIELDHNRFTQQQAEQLLDVIVRKANQAARTQMDRDLVARNEARKSWGLDPK